tara:strand:+ start:15831 stop:16694 length:864 start_codon:yes stop_codon:yes gene_type:complete
VDSVSPNKGEGPLHIGIIAGSGSLPLALAETLRRRGDTPYLLLIEKEAAPAHYADFPHEVIRIAKVGAFLKALRREGCTSVTLAGPVRRPDFKNLLPDMEGMKLLSRIAAASRKGDDGLMRAITGFLAEKGFQVIGAHELVEELLAPLGQLGRIAPTETDEKDIAEGMRIVRAVGALDIGQGAIIREGYVLAVEAAEGTDRLLQRTAEFAWDKPAGVFVKLSKPGQELKADMPTLGPETVMLAAEANLRGIAMEAGRTLIVDLEETVQCADKKGIFLVGVRPKDEGE